MVESSGIEQPSFSGMTLEKEYSRMNSREHHEMKTDPESMVSANIDLTWQADRLSAFFPLLLHGVILKVRPGSSVRSMLCDQVGISADYLSKRIGGIFVDGKAVPDVDSVTVEDGSTVALSAVITEPFLRCALGEPDRYSSGKRAALQREPDESSSELESFFHLRIYNLLTSDLGPSLFQAGIRVKAEVLDTFFATRPVGFWAGFRSAKVDGRPVDSSYLRGRKWSEGSGLVRLRVMGHGVRS